MVLVNYFRPFIGLNCLFTLMVGLHLKGSSLVYFWPQLILVN